MQLYQYFLKSFGDILTYYFVSSHQQTDWSSLQKLCNAAKIVKFLFVYKRHMKSRFQLINSCTMIYEKQHNPKKQMLQWE